MCDDHTTFASEVKVQRSCIKTSVATPSEASLYSVVAVCFDKTNVAAFRLQICCVCCTSDR